MQKFSQLMQHPVTHVGTACTCSCTASSTAMVQSSKHTLHVVRSQLNLTAHHSIILSPSQLPLKGSLVTRACYLARKASYIPGEAQGNWLANWHDTILA